MTQNRERLGSISYPNEIIRWSCTIEQITVDQLVSINCDYPGDWEGKNKRVEKMILLSFGTGVFVRQIRVIYFMK